MNHEEKLIALINDQMPPSPLRKSKSGEVDSEVIRLGDREYLFSTDDFSREDLLPENDPFTLGWNLACAALSDIVASGGKPLLYGHSMVIPPAWDDSYIQNFSAGIAAVLKAYSVSFMGGDLGISDKWRYTASVLGTPLGRIVNRRGCQAGDTIFLTGKIGAGNLAAMTSLFSSSEKLNGLLQREPICFPVHVGLSQLITDYASCAIDTSDGVFAALQTISDLNDTGFQIINLPYHPLAKLAVQALDLPPLPLFLGECGEYEILFCVPQSKRETLMSDLREMALEICELGYITADPQQRSVLLQNTWLNLADYRLKARDFAQVQHYLAAMLEWVCKRNT